VAPTADELHRLRSGVGDSAHLVTVAHVLRYTPFFRRIKALLDRGAIGELVTIEHMEHIGYWHFAHSYVRGNWRRADASSPMILAKACHDLDLLRWFAGAPWRSVASYGSLHHFHGGNRPEGARDRCAEGCPVAPAGPCDATRICDAAQPVAGPTARRAVVEGWPDDKQALLHSSYGRCVYACDNDVRDHAVVSVEFDSGVTAALTV